MSSAFFTSRRHRPWPLTMATCLMVIAGLVWLALGIAQADAQGVRVVDPQPVGRALPPASIDELDDEDDDDADSRWPMRFETTQGVLTLYQPQLMDFTDNRMTGRAAVSIIRPGEDEPRFGAIWLDSRVQTDRAQRTVRIMEVRVTQVRFPEVEDIQPDALGQAMTQAFEREPMLLSLDQLVAMLETIRQDARNTEALATTPPRIVFTDRPTVLVQYDGQPRLGHTDHPTLLRAVNTPFFVALDTTAGRYYLKGAGRWYVAPDATGPFTPLHTPPQPVAELALREGYEDPEADMAQDAATSSPRILTAIEPTELIWTDGPEQLSPIADTTLLYIANTEADVLLDIDTQRLYVLASGRWYAAASRQGPWSYVAPESLPADFQHIDPDSAKGSVLAHVPDTQVAQDAVADAYVPQTAAVDRASYDQPIVEYDGSPRFEPVDTLPITYAVNTPNAVLYIHGRYYVCYNAVWYVSNLANGPWELCTVVPREVYLIPPTSPVYPVRFVRVYEVTPTLVYVGYLPGYVGSYIHHGVVVYGTGYRYRPWVGHHYYARPMTFGFAARYDAYRAYWGFGLGLRLGGGFSLWFGHVHRVTPSHSIWFGHGGYRPVYAPRPFYRPATRQVYRHAYRDGYRDAQRDEARSRPAYRPRPRRDDFNLYERRRDVRRIANRGRPAVNVREDRPRASSDQPRRQRPFTANPRARNEDRSRDRAATRPGQATTRPSTPRPQQPRQVDRTRPADRTRSAEDRRNNVYADPQGRVYRRTDEGWERRDGRQWVRTETTPSVTTPDARPTPGSTPRPTPGQTPAPSVRQPEVRRPISRDPDRAVDRTPGRSPNPSADRTPGRSSAQPADRTPDRSPTRTQNPSRSESLPPSRTVTPRPTTPTNPRDAAPSRPARPGSAVPSPSTRPTRPTPSARPSDASRLEQDHRARQHGQQRGQVRRSAPAPANRAAPNERSNRVEARPAPSRPQVDASRQRPAAQPRQAAPNRNRAERPQAQRSNRANSSRQKRGTSRSGQQQKQ